MCYTCVRSRGETAVLGYLIALFTIVPAVELVLLIEVGQRIGAVYTVGIVVLTGVLGAFLAKLQGLLTLKRIQDDVNRGVMPAEAMFDGVIILCSGLLLLTPGFVTDFLGFAGLLPFTRRAIKRLLARKASKMIREGRAVSFRTF